MREETYGLFEHPAEKRSHYSKRTVDIDCRYGFPAVSGVSSRAVDRTDFDLSTHARASGQDLSYLDAETGERYVPTSSSPRPGWTGPCWCS